MELFFHNRKKIGECFFCFFSHEHKGLSIMLHLNMSPFQIHFCPSMDYIPIAFATGKGICFLIYWFICHMKKASFAEKMRNSGFNTIFSHTEYFFLHFLGKPIVTHCSKDTWSSSNQSVYFSIGRNLQQSRTARDNHNDARLQFLHVNNWLFLLSNVVMFILQWFS